VSDRRRHGPADPLAGRLIQLAAEMVRCSGMPSEFNEDHKWYVSTPMAERRRILEQASQANEQCRIWALELRKVADALSARSRDNGTREP
jgi:hypothetical protein